MLPSCLTVLFFTASHKGSISLRTGGIFRLRPHRDLHAVDRDLSNPVHIHEAAEAAGQPDIALALIVPAASAAAHSLHASAHLNGLAVRVKGQHLLGAVAEVEGLAGLGAVRSVVEDQVLPGDLDV